ncbi:hypothetical protein EVAR_85084_1 [Eumeta japonica]|uniref:Uncharacterized protein n=1 Tax=Eumeta variegata TaxID=151549 RepID=A0A4C1XC95_EUMVA|nr:hypothetical protein EVAR_85084_1 [Eumeta japonica]
MEGKNSIFFQEKQINNCTAVEDRCASALDRYHDRRTTPVGPAPANGFPLAMHSFALRANSESRIGRSEAAYPRDAVGAPSQADCRRDVCLGVQYFCNWRRSKWYSRVITATFGRSIAVIAAACAPRGNEAARPRRTRHQALSSDIFDRVVLARLPTFAEATRRRGRGSSVRVHVPAGGRRSAVGGLSICVALLTDVTIHAIV